MKRLVYSLLPRNCTIIDFRTHLVHSGEITVQYVLGFLKILLFYYFIAYEIAEEKICAKKHFFCVDRLVKFHLWKCFEIGSKIVRIR